VEKSSGCFILDELHPTFNYAKSQSVPFVENLNPTYSMYDVRYIFAPLVCNYTKMQEVLIHFQHVSCCVISSEPSHINHASMG